MFSFHPCTDWRQKGRERGHRFACWDTKIYNKPNICLENRQQRDQTKKISQLSIRLPYQFILSLCITESVNATTGSRSLTHETATYMAYAHYGQSMCHTLEYVCSRTVDTIMSRKKQSNENGSNGQIGTAKMFDTSR